MISRASASHSAELRWSNLSMAHREKPGWRIRETHTEPQYSQPLQVWGNWRLRAQTAKAAGRVSVASGPETLKHCCELSMRKQEGSSTHSGQTLPEEKLRRHSGAYLVQEMMHGLSYCPGPTGLENPCLGYLCYPLDASGVMLSQRERWGDPSLFTRDNTQERQFLEVTDPQLSVQS